MNPTQHTPEKSLSRIRLGARGEELAAAYLAGTGFRILARNWRTREGELDIVAREADCIVAVEVKTRSGSGYGHPLEAITALKAARLRTLLGLWVREAAPGPSPLRIDAVGVVLRPGEQPRIDHLRGIA